MVSKRKLAGVLFFLRITVFLVMFIWTLDKFLHPRHAMGVLAVFYHLPGFGKEASYLIGAVELLFILGFLMGYWKTVTYGVVLVLHGISTISSYQQYLDPFTSPNLLFFAAWPMLAACWALFVLRDDDTMLILK